MRKVSSTPTRKISGTTTQKVSSNDCTSTSGTASISTSWSDGSETAMLVMARRKTMNCSISARSVKPTKLSVSFIWSLGRMILIRRLLLAMRASSRAGRSAQQTSVERRPCLSPISLARGAAARHACQSHRAGRNLLPGQAREGLARALLHAGVLVLQARLERRDGRSASQTRQQPASDARTLGAGVGEELAQLAGDLLAVPEALAELAQCAPLRAGVVAVQQLQHGRSAVLPPRELLLAPERPRLHVPAQAQAGDALPRPERVRAP